MSFKDLIAFSTRIPTKDADIIRAAESSYLFPLIGVLIGLIYGLVSLIFYNLINPEIVAVLSIVFLYSTTGLIHLDGLSDLSDAFFASVKKEKALKILKDEKIGVGGVFSVFIILFILYVSLELLMSKQGFTVIENPSLKAPKYFLEIILLSEISAKLALTTLFKFGEETHEGLGSLFITKTNNKKFIISLVLSIVLAFLIGNDLGLSIFIGFLVGIMLSFFGKTLIEGVNGDFMGAANEISRALTILITVGFVS